MTNPLPSESHLWYSPLTIFRLPHAGCIGSQYKLIKRLTSEVGGGSVGFGGCFDTADRGLWFICAGVRDARQTGEFRIQKAFSNLSLLLIKMWSAEISCFLIQSEQVYCKKPATPASVFGLYSERRSGRDSDFLCAAWNEREHWEHISKDINRVICLIIASDYNHVSFTYQCLSQRTLCTHSEGKALKYCKLERDIKLFGTDWNVSEYQNLTIHSNVSNITQ